MSTNKNNLVFLLFGGIILGICYIFMEFYLAWFCLVPLFYGLEKANLKQTLLYSSLYGISAAIVLYYWIIPTASKYSGEITIHSFAFYAGGVIYFSLYFTAFGFGYYFLRKHLKESYLLAVAVSALFVLLEMIKINILPGLPWFHYNLAVTQAKNSWIIQWAAVGGLFIIIFVIVIVNYLLTGYLLYKKNIYIKSAGIVITLFFAGGYLSSAAGRMNDDHFSAVILNENIPAETRWNDSNGDSLANIFFQLNSEAVKYDPDIIIWSETAVPWKLEDDDQFIPRVLNITQDSRTDHLLGIFSPSLNKDLVYNSAYLINKGTITDRYDKTILLDFLEKPFTNTVLPFITDEKYNKILPGKNYNVARSGKAFIGVLICNESLSPGLYQNYVKAGANLLVSMNNDAWFEDTPLQMHHFYITRIMAVMTGRDIITNSNRGFSGVAQRNGYIEIYPRSDSARIITCTAGLSTSRTIYSSIKNFSLPIYITLIILSIFIRKK